MNFTTFIQQLGAVVVILWKMAVRLAHARDESDELANSDHALLEAAFDSGSSQEDPIQTALDNHLNKSEVPELRNRFTSFREAVEDVTEGLGKIIVEDSDAGEAEAANGMVEYADDESITDGTVQLLQRKGLLGAVYRQMENDFFVAIKNTVALGTMTALSTNVGDVEKSSGTGENHLFAGTLTLTCTGESVDAPEFSVVMEFTDELPDGSKTITGRQPLICEKPWYDGFLGVSLLQIDRSGLADPTEIDTGTYVDATTFSNPKGTDCDDGVFYERITRAAAAGAGTWMVEWFADANRRVKVGAVFLDSATDPETYTKTLTGGTVVEQEVDKTPLAADLPDVGDYTDDTAGANKPISFDIRNPREGDVLSIPVTNDEVGKIVTKVGKAWRGTLPSAPVGPTTNCTDALAGAGAGNVDNGAHYYRYSNVSAAGESGLGPVSDGVTVADKTVNGKVDLASIDAGPGGTTARKVYRTKVGDATKFYLLTTIADNVTTTYQDNTADASLGARGSIEVDDTQATTIAM